MRPMSEAKRDGSDVLLVLNGVYGSWEENPYLFARWDKERNAWMEGAIDHPDDGFIGWYDLKKLIAKAEGRIS